jgi:hypothetical protein
MQMLFKRKIFEDGQCPSPGLFAAPDLELPVLSIISYLVCTTVSMENILPLSPGLEHGKLTTLRYENRKIYQLFILLTLKCSLV